MCTFYPHSISLNNSLPSLKWSRIFFKYMFMYNFVFMVNNILSSNRYLLIMSRSVSSFSTSTIFLFNFNRSPYNYNDIRIRFKSKINIAKQRRKSEADCLPAQPPFGGGHRRSGARGASGGSLRLELPTQWSTGCGWCSDIIRIKVGLYYGRRLLILLFSWKKVDSITEMMLNIV